MAVEDYKTQPGGLLASKVDNAVTNVHVAQLARDEAAKCYLRAQLVARELGPCREVSCAITKLEEAGHWLEALARRVDP